MADRTIWAVAGATYDPVEEAEYVVAAAKLDHMARAHGFEMVTCPCTRENGAPLPGCESCDGDGRSYKAKSWEPCGAADCPLRRKIQ